MTERNIAALYAEFSGNRAEIFAIPRVALRFLVAVTSPFHAGLGRVLRLPLELEGRRNLHFDSASWAEKLGINPIRLQDFAATQTREVKVS